MNPILAKYRQAIRAARSKKDKDAASVEALNELLTRWPVPRVLRHLGSISGVLARARREVEGEHEQP